MTTTINQITKPKTYSDATRTGLPIRHSSTTRLTFEAIWQNARKPTPLSESFPYRIEGLSPSIWHNSYINESKNYHGPSISCLLCNRVQRLVDDLSKCHTETLSPECTTCQTKTRNAPYLNRALLNDLHSRHINLLTKGEVGGEVRQFRAEAWTKDYNYNKKGETLKTQMENEIMRFSKAPNLNSDYQKTEKERMNPGHGTRNEKKETPKSNTTHTEGDLTSVSALKENTERDREPKLDNNGTISIVKREGHNNEPHNSNGDQTSVSALEENTERDREPEHDNNGTISIDIGMDPADLSLADDEPWEHEFYEFYVGESGL